MEQTKTHAKKAFALLAIIVSLLAACLLAGCSSSNSQEKVELEIYAANSLTDAMNEAQELFTGNKEVLFNGATTKKEAAATLMIQNSSPLPMNILAIVPYMDVDE